MNGIRSLVRTAAATGIVAAAFVFGCNSDHEPGTGADTGGRGSGGETGGSGTGPAGFGPPTGVETPTDIGGNP